MSGPREARLGLFVPFMQAYGLADEATRDLLEAARANYAAGYITARTFQARIDELLSLPIPLPA